MTIILLDAKNALFRFGWTGRNLTNSDGNSTGAIYGLMNLLVGLKNKFPGSRFVVCWDALRNSTNWRSVLYPAYKNNRDQVKVTPEMKDRRKQLYWQIDVLKKLFALLDIPQLEDEDIEADDFVSLVASAVMEKGWQAVVYSSDLDYMQLVPRGVTVLSSISGNAIWTEKDIRERFKCNAKDVLKIRALLGDKSDGIPRAVPGVGEVAAAKYIGLGIDPSLEKYSQHPLGVRLESPRLESYWPTVHMNYRLMRLPVSPDDDELPTEVSARVRKAINRAMKSLDAPKTRSRSAYDEFIKTLTDLDLHSALNNRTELWKVQV